MNSPDFSRTVYYLPGHGGQLHTGLGEGLLSRGWHVTGRGHMLGRDYGGGVLEGWSNS